MRFLFKNKPAKHREWSAAEKNRVRELFHEGYSDEEIGAELGRTAKAIEVIRHYLRLMRTRKQHREFVIHDAMAEYFPTWYKKLLKKRWQERYSMS